MAGGRRIVRVPQKIYQNYEEPQAKSPEMKHIRLPHLPAESKNLFELIHFLHICVLTGLQYLHFYRTVWWLPQSFNSSGMSFHLINPWVICLIFTIELRKLIFNFTNIYYATMILVLLISFISYKLDMNASQLLYVIFPTCFQLNAHGVRLDMIFTRPEFEEMQNFHICSDAYKTREEADQLRSVFNYRLRSVLCSSFIAAYFSTFIPWTFVQPFVHYDLQFVCQHLLIGWMILFSLLCSRAFRPEFNDSLHKVACHLGKWTKLRPNHIPSNIWTGDSLEPGVIVKHSRELYKAEGYILVSSEPGNITHSRFQTLFIKSSLTRILLGFHVTILVMTLVILLRSNEWYQVISISTVLFMSLYTFIRLARDFIITWKIYEAEEMIVKCS